MTKKQNYLKIHYFSMIFLVHFFYGLSIVHADEWIYTIQKTDNLWDFTVDYLIDISYVERVQKINNISDPWHILPGTKIKVPSEWVRQYPSIVRVQNIQGTALIAEEGNKQSSPLKVGDMVMLGDTISTDANSTLVIVFLDGSRVLLQEKSQLRIERLMIFEDTGMSDSRLRLLKGRIETLVAPKKGTARKFQITTPATVTSVRGTDYRISAESETNKSITEVVGGEVVVKGEGEQRTLKSGFGTVTVKNENPMPPVKLLSAPNIDQLPALYTGIPIQFTMPELDDGQGYRMQIAKTKLFSDVYFDRLFYSSMIRGPDLPDGQYHLRIRKIDAQQIEGYNAERVITLNARPESPFLVSPNIGEGILLEDKLTLSWSQQLSAIKYHIQISKTESFSDMLFDSVSDDNELTVNDKMDQAKYYWRVAAIDQDGDGPFSDSQMFRRIIPAPEIEAPRITEDTLSIRSKSGLPGQTYHFQMAEDESFDELMLDEYTDKPSFELSRPNGGEYFIRMRTIDSDGFIGPFTAAQSIDIPYSRAWWLTFLPLFLLFLL